jgi:hypothetical protein
MSDILPGFAANMKKRKVVGFLWISSISFRILDNVLNDGFKQVHRKADAR